MKRLNLVQGSPEWHAHRATARNASEAPAALGCSPYMTRAELLRVRATGLQAEVPPDLERRFAAGHAIEAAQRPGAAVIVGEELYPVTGSEVVDGIELSASFDGLTMAEDAGYECKTLNDDLRATLQAIGGIDANDGRDLPKHYRVQMEQQLMVCGGERVLFVAADRDGDDVRRCWYYPDPQLRAEILAGWRQFDADLAAYVPPAATAAAPVGHTPDTLPALRIELMGQVTASNLAEFKETALGAIRSVNRELTTDQHFADAKQAVKWCGEVETRIKAAKEHALSQTASIDALFKTLDDVSAEARRVRLDLEKLVTRREVELKGELVMGAKAAYEAHETQCRQDAGAWIMLTPPDFAGAIKGKRNFESMRDALDTTLAKAKITASEQASKIRANLSALDEESKGSEHLFRDRLTFIGLTPEAVRLMARQRIAEHRAAEERRAAELAERERARIRAEEEARAAEKLRQEQEASAAEQREKNAMALQEIQGIQQQVMIATLGRAGMRKGGTIECIRETLAETEAWVIDDRFGALAGSAQAAKDKAVAEIRGLLTAAEAPAGQRQQAEDIGGSAVLPAGSEQPMKIGPAPTVIPLPTRAPAAPAPRPLTLGAIGQRLGFTLPAAFVVEKLGIEGERDRSAVKFSEHEFVQICAALAHHIGVVLEEHRQQRVA